ncbi:MAG: hypothetical protein Kow00129_13610 [Thermoleophilia bacterium]
MAIFTGLLSVLVFIGLLGGSFMTCGPAREVETAEEATACPMRKYVIAYFCAAALLVIAFVVLARG